ncbi:SRPBCC family protein [Modestobacter altitudinis]|uniref:SRPBCC family protein n=1 Tax=Modestobacter altitudinis TaxID=2213158 RepID=UPI00110CB498|nr:SRPBCC family protein [Modestobacter altitudinis]
MQLENSFTVPLPVDEAWRVLLDIDRIAPCMPGAVLDSVTGDDFTGRVKVKLGPINLTYQGKGSFIEKDETAHKAVIDARGKDQRGNGTAAAIVTATLAAEGSVTRVDVLTDLNITGRPAQFGRGVMTDVGNKLLGQFADKLSAQLASGDAGLVDSAAAEVQQEPTVATTVSTAAAKAAATTAGVVEEVATSVEGSASGGPAKKAAAAAKKTAAAAADGAATTESAVTPPVKAAPAKAAPAEAAPAASVPDPTLPPTKPAATPLTAAKKAPSKPPTGTTAPPNRPAGGGPARSTPSAPQRPLAPVEPEPIDLLEVAGGAALTRYAAPAAGGAAVLVLLLLIIRQFRK